MSFKLKPYQSASLAMLMASAHGQPAQQMGKSFFAEVHDIEMERRGWQRGNTEGYEMWVGGPDSRWPHDWTPRPFHHSMLPSPEPLTLQQFCQKFYPMPEVTPLMTSFAIGNGLYERGLFKDSQRMMDYLRNNQTRHEIVFKEIVRELMMENLIYGAGNGELNRLAAGSARAW